MLVVEEVVFSPVYISPLSNIRIAVVRSTNVTCQMAVVISTNVTCQMPPVMSTNVGLLFCSIVLLCLYYYGSIVYLEVWN